MLPTPPPAPLLQGREPLLLEIADTLARSGYAVIPDFLDPDVCRALADECRRFRNRGEFHYAAVGRGERQEVRQEIRSDIIRWLDRDDCGEWQGQYLQILDAYQQVLKRELFLPLVEFEGHCAVYPPGSFYQRHLDQFRGVGQRTVTVILYLNEQWLEEDGGQLRIYLDEAGHESLDVLPQQGTLVTFLSADYWHEVLPAHRDRLSITGWFKTRPVGNAFPLQ
jgi:SM-20-related protein